VSPCLGSWAFHKGKKVYRGQFIISSFPDPIDSNPVVDFSGTGELVLKED